MAKKKSTNVNDPDDLTALFERVMDCESAIPLDEMEPLADLAIDQDRVGRNWRLTALIASKDGTFFRDIANDAKKAQALAAAIGPLGEFEKLLRTMADLAGTVQARLMIAGCNHEKFNEWMEASNV